jgi:hypothetical protein
MTATFPPQRDDEQALHWLRHQLQWEELLDALRHARRGERPAAGRRQREPAAA